MKNPKFSLTIPIVILFFSINTAFFAQNQPEKKETKINTQTNNMNTQKSMDKNQNQLTHQEIQKDVKKSENKMTTDKQKERAKVSKDNKNNESVNTQYHKKEVTTTKTSGKQIQEKMPTKGGGNK
jgi:uncharacterized protein (UPF0333 family)